MKPSLTSWASFTVVTALIFGGMALAFSGWYSTGPNQYVSCGMTGWLDLHRYNYNWSVEHIRFGRLAAELVLAVSATWLLSKGLHALHKRA